MVEGVQAGKLRQCPFCAWSGVKVQKKERGYYWIESLVAEIRIEKAAYYVVCNRCKARGGVATGRFVGYVRTANFDGLFGECKQEVPLPDWVTTREAVKQRAIDMWNTRAYTISGFQEITSDMLDDMEQEAEHGIE